MPQGNKRPKKNYRFKPRSNEGCNDMRPIINKLNNYVGPGIGVNDKSHKAGEGITIYNLVWDGERYIEVKMLTAERSIDPTSAAFSKKMSSKERGWRFR